jgi:hypothetical protein
LRSFLTLEEINFGRITHTRAILLVHLNPNCNRKRERTESDHGSFSTTPDR